MKKAWIEPDAVPEASKHGSYPPDIARRRRALGLPVTPEEHAAYDRGEMREPPVTDWQMQRTLRDVLPRCSPAFAQVLRAIAARVWTAKREPGAEA